MGPPPKGEEARGLDMDYSFNGGKLKVMSIANKQVDVSSTFQDADHFKASNLSQTGMPLADETNFRRLTDAEVKLFKTHDKG